MNTIETAGLDCVGCRSCEHACPMHAITMGEDNEGFLFPKINREICVLCGQCLKKCPVCSDNFPCSSPLEVYAFQSGDKKALMQSASGGVSDAAAEAVLQMGGVIYGAAFHTDPSDGKILSVRHVEVTDSVDRYKIRSSKYVQSDTGDSYKLARNRLKNGQTVLFTGTPCQIAGLYSFLGGDHPCLYTLDLICHGVPSPALLRQYLKSQSHCMGGSITDMNFRSKEGKGWGTQYRLKLGSESKTVSRPFVLDKYGYHFMNGNSYRESCYRCRFSGIRRSGDLTAGDFWGVWQSCPDIDSPLGLSAVLINTEKGLRLFRQIQEHAGIIRQLSLKDAMTGQENLSRPASRPSCRDTIYSGLWNEDYIDNLKTGLQPVSRLKSLMPRSIAALLKRSIRKEE
ncbi:MAG TPA: Coenzyme F420 hydrogenase/dehydrogenase, beta subunit C-terminal domain [Candidatus Mediterraneibacter intestinigallinarum]|nr:Coenzyme F420 hydrogenase/dehydrogenase, beta subunit C-terminal domain [Candidatus Mediterraneibacter intestinigallinarum]